MDCCSAWGVADMWQLEQYDTTTHGGVMDAYLCGESALVDH